MSQKSNLPSYVLHALEKSACPDIPKVQKLFDEMKAIGKRIANGPFGTEEYILFSRASVRVSSRLTSTTPWGETDLSTIENEIAAFRKDETDG